MVEGGGKETSHFEEKRGGNEELEKSALAPLIRCCDRQVLQGEEARNRK